MEESFSNQQLSPYNRVSHVKPLSSRETQNVNLFSSPEMNKNTKTNTVTGTAYNILSINQASNLTVTPGTSFAYEPKVEWIKPLVEDVIAVYSTTKVEKAVKVTSSSLYENLARRNARIANKLKKVWKEKFEGSFSHQFDLFLKLLEAPFDSAKVLDIEPEVDGEGNFLWFNVFLTDCDERSWDKIENDIGRIAHEIYTKKDNDIVQVRKLTRTICLDVFSHERA